MYIGAAYYPELWDESEIEKDIKRCEKYGLNTLRIGEFAWSRMEPEEGRFDLDWLARVIDRLWAAGISTVLCTPTCTPPRRMMNKYEEMRRMTPDGRRESVSSRCHPCKTSPVMLEKTRAVVTAMGERFGRHPGVIGWQIDNELFVYKKGCYCPLCVAAFHKFLQKEYGTIEALNDRWSMHRWSLEYASFDDVEPPKPEEWVHPSLNTMWRKFQYGQIYSFIDMQAEILHRFTNAPVGTDMMPNNTLSYYRATKNLDVVEYNHYDTAEKLPATTFFYDFLRPIKERPFWVTETQTGWNGSEYAANGYRPQGNCYVNTWLPIAHGAEMNLYWLYRAHPNGHELAHGAVFSTAGRPYRVSEEVKQAAKDLAVCDDFLKNSRVRADVALHYSTVSEHNFSSARLLQDLNYVHMLKTSYHAAFRHHNLDVIDTDHVLGSYRVVISPFLTTVEGDFRERIEKWVKEGGTWIVGPMSDIMTADTAKYTAAPFSFLEEFAGVYTKYQKPVANNVFRAVWNDGTELGISTCYDAFEPTDSTPLATYTGDEFDGLAVVTEKKVGKGKVILVGSVLSAEGLLRLVDEAPIAEATPNIDLTARTGARGGIIAAEVENKPGTMVLDGTYLDLVHGKILSGEVVLAPQEVLVLEKQ